MYKTVQNPTNSCKHTYVSIHIFPVSKQDQGAAMPGEEDDIL